MKITAVILALMFVISGCGGKDSSKKDDKKDEKNKEKKEKQVTDYGNTTLSRYDIETSEPQIVKLNSSLVEISGLATTADGRVFGHNDEDARIFEIDVKTGNVKKKFEVGNPVVSGDFEGIAIANGMMYLVAANGNIMEFKEGDEGGNVTFTAYENDLGKDYDVEGLCYDPATNSLLLACKGTAGKDYTKKQKAVYSFSLDRKKLDEKPRFVFNMDETGVDINPSGIEFNQNSNTFFIISSKGSSIIEVSPEGEVINAFELSSKINKQPEGIIFLLDKSMVISNEGGSDYGYLAIYKYNE